MQSLKVAKMCVGKVGSGSGRNDEMEGTKTKDKRQDG